jgi:hypothetical protein
MNIAGVDVSTKAISMVIIRGDTGALLSSCEYWLDKKQPNKAERCRNIWTMPYAVELEMMIVSTVWVEQPMGAFVKGVAEVERIVGSVIAATPKQIGVSLVGPSEWKKLSGLPGNAKKDVIFGQAEATYPDLAGTSQDIHDAAMIARACWISSRSSDG